MRKKTEKTARRSFAWFLSKPEHVIGRWSWFVGQQLMDMDLETLCGAGYRERTPERVQPFLNRPIEGEWPYLWLDATYIKTRQAGRIASVEVNTHRVREILGLRIGPSEAEPFWTEFLRSLSARGLGGVKLVIPDAHPVLKSAATKVLGGTLQRCKVLLLRNALAHAGKGQRQMIRALINTAFDQKSPEAASDQWRTMADQLRERFPKLAAMMDEAAIVRLVGALLLEQNDEWQLNRRYMQLDGLRSLAQNPSARLSACAQ